jgi:glycosyltransferase involved in cell wall biosynthesis
MPKIAYLTGQYPEVSLTFILREVEELRAMGAEVLTCSIRQTPPKQHPGAAEKAAAASTFYVLQAARNPIRFLAAQIDGLRRPRQYLSAFALAWRTRPPGLKALIYQIIFFFEATVLAHHLRREGVEHIHNHFVFGSATVAMLASEMTGIPFSFTLHGPADLFDPYRWRIDEKTARARFVAVISHYARSQLMFFSDPAHWDKIKIVHCGVDPALYEQPAGSAIPPRRTDEIRLLFVGRLAPVKGLRILLDAMTHLITELPHMHLVLVGDGPDRANLEAAAAPLGDAVTFTGYLSQQDVAQAMQACDVFVLPSFAEGVPVALMEAMASGKPVIATKVAGVGELVVDKESGLLVLPGDLDGLITAIRDITDEDARRADMGVAGHTAVEADFNITSEVARLAHLFVGELGTQPRAPLSSKPDEGAS